MRANPVRSGPVKKLEPIGRLQALPKDGKPVSEWTNEDTPFADVARTIRKFAECFGCKNDALETSDSACGGTAITTTVTTRGIELTIDADLESFSNEDRKRLLKEIGKLLETSVNIHRVRKGSVKVEFRLTPDQAVRLYGAAKRGELQACGVIDAEFVEQHDLAVRLCQDDEMVLSTATP